MARRSQGVIEDIVDVTAMLPWWVGVALALVSYLVLHQFAVAEIAAPAKAVFSAQQILRTFSAVFQYILPIAFLAGAGMSAWGRHKRRALYSRVAAAGDRAALENMSWQAFEQLVGEYFRRQGYAVEESGGGGPDGGVDLVVSRGKDRYLVQCKRWKARNVDVATVRELYGVMAAQGAVGAFVVSSGNFTDEARKFSEGREIDIISGDEIIADIADQGLVLPQLASKPGPGPTSAAPACPRCGSGMVRRTARKGANAGNAFWGCSTYPACRGTRPV